MVIIGNNREWDPNEEFDILIDDGTGRKINIPVGMIGFSSGNSLRIRLQSPKDDSDYVWATVGFKLVCLSPSLITSLEKNN